MTSESSRKAEQTFSERAPRTERPESLGTEPPPSSSRTRVVRIAREQVVVEQKDTLDDEPPCSANMTMEAWAAMNAELAEVPHECVRTRLIGELSKLLREPDMPESTRTAGLTLIGWLARRMPGEAAHALGTLPPPKNRETRRPGSEPSVPPRRSCAPGLPGVAAERRPGKR